ncbi:PASTA domain-containing protein [Dactylosporangium sp. NPDC051541]|uniref:PASTA domain-containing protein n=1 Tax=Dactylosporangium sp. NPDC051541 TaxID=3363977 RepID=UPI0037B8E05C
MSTNWVVTTAAERVALDDAKRGETTFTVTNPAARADRAVFQVVPGEGADPAWFTVDQPQRQVPASGSTSFLLGVQVPAGATPGTYEVRGRVYSASEAPEESSVLSNRIVFDVAAPAAPPPRKIPLWILLVAAGLVLITVVTVTLVLTLGGGEAQQARPQPSAPAPASGLVEVPKVVEYNEANAGVLLRGKGLVPGAVKYRLDLDHVGNIVEQNPPAGAKAEVGSKVDLVVAVRLTAPNLKTPIDAKISIKGKATLQWEQNEPYVTHWLVVYAPVVCYHNTPSAVPACGPLGVNPVRVDARSAVPPVQPAFIQVVGSSTGAFLTNDGNFRWYVAAVDDFDQPGPISVSAGAQMVA